MIQCDKEIQARRPDIVVVDKCKREVKNVDIAILGDAMVCEKEIEKVESTNHERMKLHDYGICERSL